MIMKNRLTGVSINARDNDLSGIFFIIFSSFCFALVAVLVKLLKHLSLIEILFFQNIVAVIILSIALKKINISLLGNNKVFLLIGAFVAIVTELTKYYSFRFMLLADASTIHRISPFFIFYKSIIT